jgi:thiol-disulfide isomerase/thioredoxin
MRLAIWIVLSFAAICAAQKDAPETEDSHLRSVLEEAGSGPFEFIRAIEKHLEKYPDSPRRAEMERSLVKAAIETKDDERILRYGERVIAQGDDDPQTLERVIRVLLSRDDKDRATRALRYAREYEDAVRLIEKEKPTRRGDQVLWREEIDRGFGRAFVLQARALGILGRYEEAASVAAAGYAADPSAEAAREAGLSLMRTGKEMEAVERFADAFVIADTHNTDAGRADDRKRMGELYRKLRGSETGLGDLILQAYDRTAALLEKRREAIRRLDPNAGLDDPMQFTLSRLNGEDLALSSLRGKVVVFDFWATWCGPCRVQHPQYEAVKKKFGGHDDLVFLSVNTDQDPGIVAGFLERNGWGKSVYFEDGLSRLLRVNSIPTTIIANRRGEIVSRIVGFDPGRFTDILSERIREALGE